MGRIPMVIYYGPPGSWGRCICGEWIPQGLGKVRHFRERHPRRWAMGRIR